MEYLGKNRLTHRKTQTPPRMFSRTLTTLALIGMLASLTACTGTTTAMDAAIRQPQATATARTDTDLPDHIVNGGFDYPDMGMLGARDSLFVYISRKDLSYARKDTQDKANPADPPRFALPSSFDASGFAWHSTQGNTGLANEKPDDVQVWTAYDGGNHYAELAAAQTGTAIYQDIATEPGVMYKWSLRHASLDEAYLDKMSVMIGTPGHETAQQATRVSVNGLGDRTGPVGTVIATPSGVDTYDGDTDPWWETYTGEYLVPAGQTVTRLGFLNVDSRSGTQGNLLDDIVLGRLYPLHYDGNGNTRGSTPEQKQ